jgi:hypothetical protein
MIREQAMEMEGRSFCKAKLHSFFIKPVRIVHPQIGDLVLETGYNQQQVRKNTVDIAANLFHDSMPVLQGFNPAEDV